MGYVSITGLSALVQEKLNKLNSGNLSFSELDELKELSAELNERIIILHYKARENQLVKQAGEILKPEAPNVSETIIEEALTTPIHFDLGGFKPQPAAPAPKAEEPVVHKPVIEKQESLFADAEKPVEPKPEPKPIAGEPVKPAPVAEVKPQIIPESKPLVSETQPVLPVNTVATRQTLVERMQKTKITDLKTAIGLNQKFLFMNFLFEGENNSYNDAIEKLNNMPTAADARHHIRELAYVYNWNYEDENVIMFTEYVERRYV